jgi:hypothetical protein
MDGRIMVTTPQTRDDTPHLEKSLEKSLKRRPKWSLDYSFLLHVAKR